jgi:hypothetical protein
MVRATALNPESVRTELQRMKREGLITSRPAPPDKNGKRGGRPSIYRLSDSPEIRLKISSDLEFFHHAEPITSRPSSRHYWSAQQYINEALCVEGEKRDSLIARAEEHLEIAEQAEGGELASEQIRAYLELEKAKIAYLRRDYGGAIQRFEQLHSRFLNHNDALGLRQIEEFRVCIEAWNRFRDGKEGDVGETALARCLSSAISDMHYTPDSPLIALLRKLVNAMVEPVENKINAEAMKPAMQLSKQTRMQEVQETESSVFFR